MEKNTPPDSLPDLPVDPDLDWLDDFYEKSEEKQIENFLDSLEDMLVKDGPFSDF